MHRSLPSLKFVFIILAQRVYSETRKEEFSPALADIISEESVTSALMVLEKGYETISDRNCAFIAQTIARLHKSKTRNFEKAIEWAEKADNDWPDNSAIVDTVGHVYKNDLKDRLKKMCKKTYTLSDQNCAIILGIGKEAVQRFQEAAYLDSIRKDRYDDDETEEPAPLLFAGYHGEIETNLKILSMFMNSANLQNSRTLQPFIALLTNVKSGEFASIFPEVSWSWEEFHALISSLWWRTLECFQKVTNKLNYFNIGSFSGRPIGQFHE